MIAPVAFNVSTTDADAELRAIQQPIRGLHLVSGAEELVAMLEASASGGGGGGGGGSAQTLDLIGHSAGADNVLVLGDWRIDGDDPAVRALCERLAGRGTLRRLGVCGVRLIGCYTAASARAREKLDVLGALLGVPVRGTTCIVDKRCFDEGGLKRVYGDVFWMP